MTLIYKTDNIELLAILFFNYMRMGIGEIDIR